MVVTELPVPEKEPMLLPLFAMYKLAILLASAFMIVTFGFAGCAGRAAWFMAERRRRVIAALLGKPNK
jgi:hypothetical protein